MPRNPPAAREAERERGRRYYSRNRAAISAARKEKRKDPEHVERLRSYHRQYYLENVKRKYKYGLTMEQFAERLAAQGGRCAICGTDKPSGRGDWHLDHDHAFAGRDAAGHRGILCAHCNVMLGMANDDESRLQAAASYVAAWKSRINHRKQSSKEES